VWWCGALLPSS
jgi:hypothetical protein